MPPSCHCHRVRLRRLPILRRHYDRDYVAVTHRQRHDAVLVNHAVELHLVPRTRSRRSCHRRLRHGIRHRRRVRCRTRREGRRQRHSTERQRTQTRVPRACSRDDACEAI